MASDDPLMALTERIDQALAAERIEFGPNALAILERGGTVGLSAGERWSMALAAAAVGMEALAEQWAATAERIRRELVCCDLYARINDTRTLTLQQAQATCGWHDLCYWGEAAARLAEDPR